MTDQTGAPFETRLTAALQEWVAQAHDPRPAADIANVAMRPRGLRSRLGGTRRSRRMLYFAVAAVLLVTTSYIGARLLHVPLPNLIDQVPQPVPTPTMVPTTTPPPNPTAAEIADWTADICGINATFGSDLQRIIFEDFREPRPPTLEQLKQVEADRRPSVEAAYRAARDALNDLTPYPGGEPFRQAMLTDFQSAIDEVPATYDAIANATTVDEIYDLDPIYDLAAGSSSLATARSVLQMDVAFSDALAASPTFCRWYEYDARARVKGIETPDFSAVAFEDDFDDDSNFTNMGFDSGQQRITDGMLKLSFASSYKYFVAAPGQFGDARIETHLRFDNGSYFAGLACRGDDATGYQVLIDRNGQVLINASDAIYHMMGRVVPPETVDASNGIDLAVECFGGDSDPFTIVVYMNGERVAEVQADHATVSEGPWGIFANSYSAGDAASFDSLRILVEP
jgi:hypothetical protein